MNTMRRHASCGAALLAGVITTGAFAAEDQAKSHGADPGVHAECSMHDMEHSMSGDQDTDFAAMMRRHHEMGLRMAEKQLKEGKDPEMKAMAQKIRDAQKKEIAQFDAWLAKRKAESAAPGAP